jgi:signal peptidase II
MKLPLLPVVALATIALDQASKLAVVFGLDLVNRGEIDVWPPFLVFRMAWNRGMNFGLFAQDSDLARWVMIAVALAISAWVWIWVRREGQGPRAQVAAGLLIGGAIGNVIDRIAYGAVADFLNMSCCRIENPFAFNVADVAIFLGALGLVFFSNAAGGPPRAKTRTRRKTT